MNIAFGRGVAGVLQSLVLATTVTSRRGNFERLQDRTQGHQPQSEEEQRDRKVGQ